MPKPERAGRSDRLSVRQIRSCRLPVHAQPGESDLRPHRIVHNVFRREYVETVYTSEGHLSVTELCCVPNLESIALKAVLSRETLYCTCFRRKAYETEAPNPEIT